MLTADDTARAVLTKRLEAGEHLLWSGMPRQGLLFFVRDVLITPFALALCSILFLAIYRNVSAENFGSDLAITLYKSLAFGVYFLAGRFVFDIYRRKYMYYGVTDRNIIIIRGVLGRIVIPLERLGDVSLFERMNGSGEITFGVLRQSAGFPLSQTDLSVFGRFSVIWWGYTGVVPGIEFLLLPMFESVANVRQVHSLIQQARRKT